jgi:murein DD-endopeptidase MepM/ murein hydrolase activator NlpD
MQYPVKNPRVTQNFGNKGHNGIDFGCSTGTPVYAAESGTIYFEGWGENSSWMLSRAGICILIDHGNQYTGYAHLQNTVINKGQRVVKGQLIGHSDSTGSVTGPHLHFEVIGKPPIWSNGYSGRVKPPVLNTFVDAGAVVKAPVIQRAVATVKAISPTYYKVRCGDNLSKIAAAYRISLSALAKLNPQIRNLNLISIGQSIRVK